jgi:deoxyribodipyrimidine photo-lyase
MSRDQRVDDNWALVYAMARASDCKSRPMVVFTLTRAYPNANLRHFDFMLRGLKEVEHRLGELNIEFALLTGEPAQTLPSFISTVRASLLVSDFDPLVTKRQWKQDVCSRISIPHHEVDAHNIVPCWEASPKLEFGAYTLRPKIKKKLSHYLSDFPELSVLPGNSIRPTTDWGRVADWLEPDRGVRPVRWLQPGECEAIRRLNRFIEERLVDYWANRNDPTKSWQSDLSPYLHFGQLSAQRVAIEVLRADAPEADKAAFLDELIVRRELSDNFCLYNPHYSSFAGFPDWARETHRIHRFDVREYIYSLEDFERGLTHDPLWNAAQHQMVYTGKMHGYMRMYWAKKILEWTCCPEEALQFAIYLNDKYSLDGRDPNGYAGIAWSVGGMHDRAWPERPFFGKIRYMNYEGCKRKFDVDGYIRMVEKIKGQL